MQKLIRTDSYSFGKTSPGANSRAAQLRSFICPLLRREPLLFLLLLRKRNRRLELQILIVVASDTQNSSWSAEVVLHVGPALCAFLHNVLAKGLVDGTRVSDLP